MNTMTIDTIWDVLVLLAKPAELPADAFVSALQQLLAHCAGVETELATLVPKDAVPALAHLVANGSGEALPEAIVTLRGSDAALSAVLAGTGQGLARIADRSRSTICAARRHTVLPGNDGIRLFFGLRRLQQLDRAAFHDYWLNRHAALGRRLIPPYSYHQLHACAAGTDAASAASGIPAATLDGVVEVHFPDIDAFVVQMSRPEVASEALADERNFIDHARSLFWVYQTH